MGRKPGSINKISHSTKSNIEQVFDLLGGTHGMYAWARENPGAFYLGLYSKLIPKNIEAKVDVQSLEALVASSATDTDLVIEHGNVVAIDSRQDEEGKPE